MSRCQGCGIILQNKDENKVGYTPNKSNKLCQRCFKITNYNNHDLKSVNINNNDILKKINNYHYFNIFLCDILSLNTSTIKLFNKINNPKIIVITKIDILPDNIKLNTLKQRIISSYNLNELLFISIKNNNGIVELLKYFNVYERVVLCGPTSSGKSSLINYIFKTNLTISNYKNTTQDFIALPNSNNTIIDSPGFNIDNIKDIKLNNIVVKTINLKNTYELIIDNIVFRFKNDCNLTIYISSNIPIKTRKYTNEYTSEIKISNFSDITINNIGFIYLKDSNMLNVSEINKISIRKSIVGGI